MGTYSTTFATIENPSSFAVAVDPNAPTISTLVGEPVNGWAIEVRGTGEAGDTITLYADGSATPVGTGTVAANGSFDIDLSPFFHPPISRVPGSLDPWLVSDATGRGAEPSV